MIRTIGFLCFLLLLLAGCAPSDPRNVEDAAPIGPLTSDYQDRVKADLSRSLADPAGAIYTFDAAPSIVNLGKRRAGVRYAWYVCGTVNAREPRAAMRAQTLPERAQPQRRHRPGDRYVAGQGLRQVTSREKPLDVPEQCCGVCLPTLAQGGSASCPLIVPGRRAASRPLDRDSRHQPVPHTGGARGLLRRLANFPTPITVRKNSRSFTAPHAQFRVASFPERTDPLTGDYR